MAEQQVLKLRSSLSESISKFTFELYKTLCAGGEQNVVMSPYSVSAAFMLTMLGCDGASKSQIMETLRLQQISVPNIHEEYEKLHTALNSSMHESTVLSVANKLFPKQGLTLKETYSVDSKRFYKSELEFMDYSNDAEGSKRRVNDWVEKETNGKIKDLIPSGSITGLTLIILANAIYFKGEWEKKFPVENTILADFHVSDTVTRKVEMMGPKPESKFRCCVNEKYKCKALEIPYKERKMSMVLLLPDKVSGLGDLEKQMNTSMFNEINQEMSMQEAILSLPKFKFSAEFELKSVLSKMGIVDVFSSEKANMAAMFQETGLGAHVSDVIHKAFIEVNEQGTEAAAATAIVMRALCLPMPPLEFIANRPFLFVIRDNSSGTILFIGRHSQPSEN